MGRAIVRDPSAFLMDEPLSNLDAKLRVQMRTEVSRLQRELSTTTVYVTHDQTEAMTLGDRVAVMRGGVLQQVDTPRMLYNSPVNIFVAGFIGSPAMNFFSGDREGRQAHAPVRRGRRAEGLGDAGDVIVGIRPEDFEDARLAPENAATASSSRRRSRCSSRWARRSTRTSPSRAARSAPTSSPSSRATRASPTCPAPAPTARSRG